jgi:hypothetical protein
LLRQIGAWNFQAALTINDPDRPLRPHCARFRSPRGRRDSRHRAADGGDAGIAVVAASLSRAKSTAAFMVLVD